MISESMREAARERDEWLGAKMRAAQEEAFDYGWREGGGIPTSGDIATGELHHSQARRAPFNPYRAAAVRGEG